MSQRPPVLYISRTGMLEPLGQSQVLSYLRGLAQTYDLTLVSFEKNEGLANSAATERIRQECLKYRIRWLPQRYLHRPRAVASSWNMLVLVFICLREVLFRRARLIHARAYVPAAAAMLVKKLTGTPFIFDMRSLWPEELVTSGRIHRGSLLFRIIAAAERACLKNADTVVSLTLAGADHLRQQYPRELAQQRIVINPTCTDLNRFTPAPRSLSTGEGGRVYGCHGSILSGWFRVDMLGACMTAIAKREPLARFQIITRDDPALVRAALGVDSAIHSRLEVYAMPPDQIHMALQQQDVSLMFYAGGSTSELGRSPTRMGEVLGCGQPIIANSGVGDVAQILREHQVGVLLSGTSDAEIERSLAELDTLMLDSSIRGRCRATALAAFSLDQGTRVYDAVYRDLLGSAAAVVGSPGSQG